MHVQQLSQWRSGIVGPWTLCLFINWATCLKRLRTPALSKYKMKRIGKAFSELGYAIFSEMKMTGICLDIIRKV